MDAARSGHLACVRLLASSAGSDLGTEDRMGRTVVEVAAQAGACEVLQFLRTELGIDLNSGLSLHAAARHNLDLSDIHMNTIFVKPRPQTPKPKTQNQGVLG